MSFEFSIPNTSISQQKQNPQTTEVLWNFLLNLSIMPKPYFPTRVIKTTFTESSMAEYQRLLLSPLKNNEGNAHTAV